MSNPDNKGNLFQAKGDFLQAIREYKRAISLQPDFAVAYVGTDVFPALHLGIDADRIQGQ